MIASRRCPSTTPLSASAQIPLSSGPRCRSVSFMASPAARNASADVAARQSIRPAMPHMVMLQTEAFAAPGRKPSNNDAPRNSYFLVKSRAFYAWASGGLAGRPNEFRRVAHHSGRTNGAGRSHRQCGGLHERSRDSNVAPWSDRQRLHGQLSLRPTCLCAMSPCQECISPTAVNREAIAEKANVLELGPCRPFP